MKRIKDLGEIVTPLLAWYDENKRALPWRIDPTPYHVWISEIMLQQTRVSAVIAYYLRFLAQLPNASSLASVSDDRLMKLWQGLGYYRRAKNLKKAAQIIMSDHDGIFPDSPHEIRKLPGIGEYTAGAIASIAYGFPVPAVDGNVLRIASRLLCEERSIDAAKTRQDITDLLQEAMPKDRPGDFNQALMDLGATICLPKGAPLCGTCPISSFCLAHRDGKEPNYPIKAPKKPRRIEYRNVYLILHQNKIALHRRPKKGLLAGLWELPNESAEKSSSLRKWGFTGNIPAKGPSHTHIFSHIEWRMQLFFVEAEGDSLPAKSTWVWAGPEDLRRSYALPSAFQFFIQPFTES